MTRYLLKDIRFGENRSIQCPQTSPLEVNNTSIQFLPNLSLENDAHYHFKKNSKNNLKLARL